MAPFLSITPLGSEAMLDFVPKLRASVPVGTQLGLDKPSALLRLTAPFNAGLFGEATVELHRKGALAEGLAVGISSGANIWAALQLAKRPEFAGKRIVTIACSPSERYLSTALAEKIRAEVTALTAS